MPTENQTAMAGEPEIAQLQNLRFGLVLLNVHRWNQEDLRREIQMDIKQMERREWMDEETLFNKLCGEIDRIESLQLGN